MRTVLDILKAHNDDSRNTMRAFLILSVDRRNSIAEADEVVDLAVKFKSAGVVGVDLCGDPARGHVRIFQDSFTRAKASGLKITLHFAESKSSASDLELKTLLSWKPDRLGHVIHVKEEFRKVIEQHAIGVELCLSCNVHAKMITGTYSDHHFGVWRHSSVPVALSVCVVHGYACRYQRLTCHRRMTSEFFAVRYHRSTTSRRCTFTSIGMISERYASERSIQSLPVQLNMRVSNRFTPLGRDGRYDSLMRITSYLWLHKADHSLS